MTRSNRRTLQRWLERIGLHRPELRAWAMYDWANSAFVTTIMAAIFPIFYRKVAASSLSTETATLRFTFATVVALALTAIISPLLGALSDFTGRKKRFLLGFQALSVAVTATMWFIGRGDWLLALALFVVANIGVAAAFTFYDSLLPHVARKEELDRVSTAGYALGYLGGGTLLALNLLWIQKPQWFGFASAETATRASFVSVAVWWSVFAIPLFLRVPEPPRQLEKDESAAASMLGAACARLLETFHALRRFKHAFLMMIAFFVYNDGISTIIRMATIYGEGIGIDQNDLILALMLVQFVGIPFAFLFGLIAGRIGAKRSIFIALSVYLIVTVLAYRMTTAAHFYLLAFLVATVQGGSQALSRSLFASMIPRHRSAEFFGFFGVFEKFAGILGPLVFGSMIAFTGSSRNAILAVASFFIVGGALLSCVDVADGQRNALEIEAQVVA